MSRMRNGRLSVKKTAPQVRMKLTIAEWKWWNILKRQAAEFCRETGLHGYKYISQTQRSKTERIIWTIIVLASLCCALVLMRMAWNYYAHHPTLTVIESTHHGIWNYPFPAITVCNLNRVSYSLTKQFVEKLKVPNNISKEFLIEEMRLLNELVMPGIFGYDVRKNLSRLQDIIDYNSLSILEVTKNCSSMLATCKWRGVINQCDKYFKQSLSRDGLCCSFNYYTSPNINDNITRSASCGFETGMTMLLNPDPTDYHATIIGSYGVKVMIHYSLNYPDYNSEIQLVRMDTQHFISINPIEMYAKPEVRDLAISTRKCIFNDEANHSMYRKNTERNLTVAGYTYHNCIAECRATVIRSKCGCIPFYFPQNSSRVCNLRDAVCVKTYKYFFDTSWPGRNLSYKTLPRINIRSDDIPCGCIPDCEVFKYPIESSFATLDSSVYYTNGSFTKNPQNAEAINKHSILHVFFNDLVAFQYRRSANYSWRNVFASFGGLLGLFAGFSLMSIFEFIYFFIVRVFINACMNYMKRRKRSSLM